MRRSCLLPFLGLALALGGCSGDSYKFARVSGRVTLNDQPLANASVVFSPVATEGNVNPGPDSGARTDADGRYTLTITGKDSKGAVVGKHKVRITYVHDSESTDDTLTRTFKKLPTKYSGRDTTLEFDVPSGGTDAADFKLTSP